MAIQLQGTADVTASATSFHVNENLVLLTIRAIPSPAVITTEWQ